MTMKLFILELVVQLWLLSVNRCLNVVYKKQLFENKRKFISFILVDTNVNSFYNATLDFRRTAKCKQKVYCTITEMLTLPE